MKNENASIVSSGRSAKAILFGILAILNLPFIAIAIFFAITIPKDHSEKMDIVNRDTTVQVYGIVIDHDEKVSKSHSTHRTYYSYASIYEYKIDGTTYTLTNDTYSDDLRDIGDKVLIYHDTATGEAVSEESWIFD